MFYILWKTALPIQENHQNNWQTTNKTRVKIKQNMKLKFI